MAAAPRQVIVTAADAGSRLCALAVYLTSAALVLLETTAVVVSLFTGSTTMRTGAGLVILAALALALAARAALLLRR